MIGAVYSTSNNLVVNNGGGSNVSMTTHPSPYDVAYSGQVRFNGTTQLLETFNGWAWMPIIPQTTSIGLSTEAESLLEWAKKKREEDLAIERLANSSVTIAGLVREKKDLEDKIKMVQILLKEEVQLGTS